jgi:hypothetical protein
VTGFRQYNIFVNKDGNTMDSGGDIDQFQLLEEKVEHLIELVTVLKREKDSIVEKAEIQEEKMADLTKQNESLRSDRDKAKQRILTLLEKIEQIGI